MLGNSRTPWLKTAHKLALSFITGILLTAAVAPAGATLIGDTVHFESRFQGSVFMGNSFDFQVEAGSGDSLDFTGFRLDVEASSFSIVAIVDAANIGFFFEWELNDLHWVGMPNGVITGATITQQTGFFATLPQNAITTTDHSVVIDLNSLGINFPRTIGDRLDITLQTDHRPIAEPGALALFGIGLAGLGFVRRRKHA